MKGVNNGQTEDANVGKENDEEMMRDKTEIFWNNLIEMHKIRKGTDIVEKDFIFD